MHQDTIADFLTRVRNAIAAKHRYVDFVPSKMRMELARVLKENGFTGRYLVDESTRRARIYLKYTDKNEPVLLGLQRVSRPSLRRYVKYQEIPKIYGGMGMAVLSTSSGILSGRQARARKVGGELICLVW